MKSRGTVVFLLIIFFIGLVDAQEQKYVTRETIVTNNQECAYFEMHEIGTFLNGAGNLMKHCVNESVFSEGEFFVINSYFEILDGSNNCLNGGDLQGSFNDYNNNVINLCVYKSRGSLLNIDRLIKNVSINNFVCYNNFYNTGITLQVKGSDIVHCALGGSASGGVKFCNSQSHVSFPLDIGDDCSYNMADQNALGIGVNIGTILEAEKSTGDENCPEKLNCACTDKDDSLAEFNCINEDEIMTDNCVLNNAIWTNNNLEEIENIGKGEGVNLVADVSENCEIGRGVKCDIYKSVNELESLQLRKTLFGEIKLTTNSNRKIAFCSWNADTFNDDNPSSYYFKIWFSNDSSSSIKSDEILVEEGAIEDLNDENLEDENFSVHWNNSEEFNEKVGCDEDMFAVRLNWDKMICADFWAGNLRIKWGEQRTINSFDTFRGLHCNKDEGIVALGGKTTCAIMELEDERKIIRNIDKYHPRSKKEGCNENEVIFALNVFHNRCAFDLHVDNGESSEETDTNGGEIEIKKQDNIFNGLWNTIKNIAGSIFPGILSGIIGG